MKLKDYASLAVYISTGWVWLPEKMAQERQTIKLRSIVKNKIVYCKALQIGSNFVEHYNRTFHDENDHGHHIF